MLKHYVHKWYAAGFFAEDSFGEVTDRTPEGVPFDKNADRICYSFEFFDREETEADGEILKGEFKNPSAPYFRNCKIYTLRQAKKEFGSDSTLVRNMEGNGWRRVAKAVNGFTVPLPENAIIIKGATHA